MSTDACVAAPVQPTARTLPGYYFITPVWGGEYTRLFVDVVIPAQLAPGNLPAFKNDPRSRYIIHTTLKDAEAIRGAPSFRSLSEYITPSLEIIDEKIELPHDTMSNCFRRGIAASEQIGAAAIFLTPDLVFADGSFAALKRLAEAGRDVVFVPGIRTLKQGVSTALLDHHSEGTAITIPPRELMRLALDNLHPLAELSWWEEGESDLVPANLYWRVKDEGIVARCFHLHPLLVHAQRPNARFFGTVDDDYFCAACPDTTRDHVVTDSDELLAIELSDASRIFATGIPKRSVEKAAQWAERAANGRHRQLFKETLRLHTEIRDPAAWAIAERRAGAIAKAIEQRLARPLADLIPRVDPALVPRLLRLAIDRRLVRANDLAPSVGSAIARQGVADRIRRLMVDLVLETIWRIHAARIYLGALHRDASRFVFGSPVRPRIWSANYVYQRQLTRDLVLLLNDAAPITIVVHDPKLSHIFGSLEGTAHKVSPAFCTVHERAARFIAGSSKAPLQDDSQDIVVIDRSLFLLGRLDGLIQEAGRVLKPGGRLMIFAKRIAAFNLIDDNLFYGGEMVARLMAPSFTMVETRTQGRLGCVLQIIIREWLRAQSLRWPLTRMLLKPLFPILLFIQALSGLIWNAATWVLDVCDGSRSFYVTSLTVGVKEDPGTADG